MGTLSRLGLLARVLRDDNPRAVIASVVISLVFLFVLLLLGYGERPGPLCELPCAPGGWR